MKKDKNQDFRRKSIWLVYAIQLDFEIVDVADGVLKRPWILTVVRRKGASTVSRQMQFRVPSLGDYNKVIERAETELHNSGNDWPLPQVIETDNSGIFRDVAVQQAVAKLDVQLVRKAIAPPTDKGKI